MRINEIKEILLGQEKIVFRLEDGKKVPAHFHVTEVGKITKHFMDCGGKERMETKANFQLWSSIDLHHRLSPEKLIGIIELSQKKLGLEDEEIEVEYQGKTIGKYGLDYRDGEFLLTSMSTACLAMEDCGVPVVIQNLAEKVSSCCSPGAGCC